MKKLLSLMCILILTLLSSSCGTPKTGETKPPPAPLPVYTVPNSHGVALPSGTLPDAPFRVPKPPERYYQDTTFELIPSPDYGRIWPYIGGWTSSMMGTSSELFGICDESGKIICDPVYNDVTLINHGGDMLYAFIKNKLEQGGGFYNAEYPTTLAAIDGSWTAAYESVLWQESYADEWTPVPEGQFDSVSFVWREPVSFDYITARQDGKWGVIGWDGTLLLPFEYREPVCFYEGLASVLSEDGNFVFFIDITGKTVLGPYQAPPIPVYEGMGITGLPHATYKLMFYEGYARFYENGKFGMIDRFGKVVIPAEYDFITSFHNGTAQIVLDLREGYENRKCGVINNAGDIIFEPAVNNWLQNRFGLTGFWDNSDSAFVSINYDGTQERHEDKYPVFDGMNYIFKNSGNEFPSDIYDIYGVEGTKNEIFIIADRERSVWRLHDSDGNPLTPEKPGIISYYSPSGYSADYIWMGAGKYGEWTWPPSYTLYDLSGNQVLDGVFKTIIPFGDKFLVRGERTAGLMDKDGDYIIEVSVLAHGID